MQPHIALTYNSQQGNGFVGIGWNISGLSSIYRCNLTAAQDAAPAPVALVVGDGYCMDGQRLRMTSGTYGESGSTYQTEVANFVNVTAAGTTGNGPSYFTAQDAKGRTYTYGNGGNSQVVLNGTATSWLLSGVSDAAGNTMTITYAAATGSAVPSTISWTPTTHGSGSYNYVMQFNYQTLPAVVKAGYLAGQPTQSFYLLNSIEISSAGAVVKDYFLQYAASTVTGQETLTSVTECADSGEANCLLPTKIQYQPGQAGVSSTGATTPGVLPVLLYDFNGDGLPDAAYYNNGVLYIALNTGSGFGTPIDTGITDPNAMFGDVLGTGSDGIVANNNGTYYYYTYNSSSNSFSGVTTGVVPQASYSYVLTDITGDGLPDLVGVFGLTDTMVTIQNTSNAGVVSFGTPYNFTSTFTTGNKYQILAGVSGHPKPDRYLDFNGDGRYDVFLTTTSETQGSEPTIQTNYYELISQGPNAPFQVVPVTFASASRNVVFGNFNDDNCTDVAVGNEAYFSGCNGTIGLVVPLSGSDLVITAIDWDGDGRTDLLAGAPGGVLNWYHATGAGFATEASTGWTLPSTCPANPTVVDMNGDGLEDLDCWSTYYPHNGVGTPPNLVSSIQDGYGNSFSPTYVSLVSPSNYTEDFGSEATYPYQDYIGPMYVVSQVTFSDPTSSSGGTFNQTMGYYGAWTNLQGRGWQSFYMVRTYDSRNALYDYRYFEQSFPSTGMQFEHIISNGTFNLTQTVNTLPSQSQQLTLPWLQSSTAHQQRYFPYFSNSTTSRREVGGNENGDLITTSSTNYTFDNYGNPTLITRVVTDNDPNSPYSGQTWTTTTTDTWNESTSPWCLTLLSTSQVAYTASGGGTGVTVNKTFTPNTTECNYTQIVTQPGTSFQVTEALAYDPFGNVNSDTITGTGMTPRATTTNWGTTGQFVNTLTDPSGAPTTWTYTSAQSLGFGVPDSVKDANNLTTASSYDVFGREIQRNLPDGTYITHQYSNCAPVNECLAGTNGLIVGYDVYGTDGKTVTFGSSYSDPVERPLVNLQVTLGGWYSRTDTRYDPLGRIHQKSFPCQYSSFATACTYWTTNSYDVLNRPTQSQRPISSTNSTLQTTSYAYAGRTTTVTDALSNARAVVADVNGWLRQTKDPMGYSVTTAYDAAGNKTSVTDNLGNTLWGGTYNYGIKAFLATANDNDMGSWSFTNDALGEITAWTDAKSQPFSETYDALSRPLTRTEPDLFTQWTYGSSASSHNIGKLQSVCTGTGNSPINCTGTPGYSESEAYDSDGRLSQRAITLPGTYGGTFTYAWAYNATTGLLNTLTYPASYPSTYALQVQYGYANGVLQTVTDVSDTPNVTVWTANTADPMGHVTEETLGNGIVTNRSFDAVTGWLGSAESGLGGGSGVKNLAFLYDEMGDVAQRQDNNLGLTENIYYDNDYRFSYSKLGTTQNLSVGYDLKGNITSRSDVAGGATWTYGASQIHAVTQAGSSAYVYAYDANGNSTSRQGNTIAWSSYNYPTTVNAGSGSTAETVSFNYGPSRQRWQQSYSGNSITEVTDYVGRVFEVVTSGGVTNYRHYINAGGENVAVYSRQSNGTNTFNYMLSDHQASAASITNSSGAQVVGESFTAFGNHRNPTTWSGADSNSDLTTIAGITRQGYTFQTALGLWMGMNHMNGRVEDAVTGRMLSADPNIPDKTSPQSYNRYSYVNNNPLTLSDPSGFISSSNCVDQCPQISGIQNGSVHAGAVGVWNGVGAGAGSVDEMDEVMADNPVMVMAQQIANFVGGLNTPAALSGALAGLNQSGSTSNTSSANSSSGNNSSGNSGYFNPAALALAAAAPIILGELSNEVKALANSISYVGSLIDSGLNANLGIGLPGNGSIGASLIAIAPFAAEFSLLNEGVPAIESTVAPGDTLYRVFGGSSGLLSPYWTTVNPATMSDFRLAAALPDTNTGQFFAQATLLDTSGVVVRMVQPFNGQGGWINEVVVPNPLNQVCVNLVCEVPPFPR